MADGGVFETDVELVADGSSVDRALATVEARVAAIQKNVTKIMEGSKQAANAFGGTMQKTLADFNKMVGILDRFHSNVQKLDPLQVNLQAIKEAEALTAKQRTEDDKAWAANQRRREQDGAAQKKQVKDINSAWAAADSERAAQERKASQQRAQFETQYDRDFWNSREGQLKRYEALGEASVARLNKTQLTADKTADDQRAQLQRIRDQNTIKSLRDQAQQQVSEAQGLQSLQNLQLTTQQKIADLRNIRDNGTPEQQRQALQLLDIEKQRLKLIDQRIATESKANAESTVANNAILQLKTKQAREDEQALLVNADLATVRTRQAELQDRIATRAARINNLALDQRSTAEQLLKLDQARLAAAEKIAGQLENQNKRLIEQAQPKPGTIGPPLPPGMKLPGAPGEEGGGGGGLFGATGLAGIAARTLAYGTMYQVIFGIMGAIKNGLSYTVQFDDAMQRLGAISGATQTQTAELAKTIADIGANSRFATLDLVQAATTLAQAGFSQADIANSLKNISQIATASGSTIAEATDVVTSALGAFNLNTSETGHIADVLTVALNRTKLNLTQVAAGIQYAGATAHENNVSFEELTATLAVMAQAGIKSGSTMGTGLREVLAKLLNPTKKLAEVLKDLGLSMKDIDVKTQGLPEVINKLAEAGFSAADAYKAFGTRGAAAFLVLKNNKDAIFQEIIAQNQLGAAATAAAKGQDSLTAEWQRFKNILDAGIEQKMKGVTDGLKEYLKTINDGAGDAEIQHLQKLYDNTGWFDWAAQDKIDVAMAHHLDDIQALTDAEAAHSAQIEENTTALNKATDEYNKHTQALQSVDDATARVYMHENELKNDHIALQAETSTLMVRFQGLAKYLDNAALSFEGLTAALQKYRLEELKLQGVALNSIVATNRANRTEFFGTANSTLAAAQQRGLFQALPANVRSMIGDAAHHWNNPEVIARLSDAGEHLTNNSQKQFVEQYVNALQRGAGADVAIGQARFQQEVNGQLATPLGQKLQAEVASFNGKPDSSIKAEIAKIQARMKGKSASGQAADIALISQLEGMLGSGTPPEAPAGRAHRGRHNDLAGRQDRAIDAEAIKADQAQLSQAIKGLLDTGSHVGGTKSIDIDNITTLTPEQFQKNIERVDDAFDAWVADRTKQVEDQIKHLKLDPSKGKGAQMMNDLQQEIAAKREETQRQVADAITKALSLVVETIEEVAKRAQEAADHAQRMADARVSSLGRASLAGKIPDYVQQTYERQAAYAKDNRDLQTIKNQEDELDQLRSKYQLWSELIGGARDAGWISATSDNPAMKSLRDLNDQITQLQDNTDELKASFGGDGLIPKSLNDSLRMAIDNFREVNHLTASWKDMIAMDLTNALGVAQSSLTQFFSDIISGNATMAQSFQTMVKAVIGYLSQLLAKMIAVKLMDMALNLFGGNMFSGPVDTSNLVGSLGGAGSGLDFSAFAPHLYGGEVHALSGRYITDGVPNRDSVPARIARGEYVVQKRAVDSVGVDFMDRLNKHGAMALQAMGPKIVLPPPANQLMNVWVVQPEHQPQMGPNDVLVTVAQDIYRGGQTKQLIKQVAQGG